MIIEHIYLGELHPDQVARYCELHDNIPAQIELNLREMGTTRLDIFLAGTTLCMRVVQDDSLTADGKNFDQAAEDAWQETAGACFAVKWRLADRVYSLTE